MIISKLISHKLYKKIRFPKSLPMNLTFGLTYKCNSRCKTCNIWKIKKFDKELSLEEIKKIFYKIGKNNIHLLVLTGGEPFLHPHLAEICWYIEKICLPHSIVIPTNCLIGGKIVEKTKEILSKFTKTHFTINLSLDGIEKKQDQMRGIPGNFKKTIETYQKLKELEKTYSNFDVSFHTVISKFNFKDFPLLFDYVEKNLKPKNYITEIAENRKELCNMKDEITPSYIEYAPAINFLIRDLKKRKLNFKQAFRLEYYKIVKEILRRKTQIIPCYAGIASAQIDPTGEVWFCCVRAESVGNLREVNYDLRKLWYNNKAEKQRKSIANKECYCPLASANYTNISLKPTKAIKVLWHFFKSKLK